ncbi:MAG: hypothetical protein ACI97A_002691 [Planctomycetota bacterium]|jgi:hypothetical protein
MFPHRARRRLIRDSVSSPLSLPLIQDAAPETTYATRISPYFCVFAMSTNAKSPQQSCAHGLSDFSTTVISVPVTDEMSAQTEKLAQHDPAQLQTPGSESRSAEFLHATGTPS